MTNNVAYVTICVNKGEKMQNIAILTDTNSGIMQDEPEQNLYVIPMPVIIDGDEYFEGKNITHPDFYVKQTGGSNIKTSQPSVGIVNEMWDKLLQDYENIIYIPMSSALSSSCQSALSEAQNSKYKGKVWVVDNKRISCAQKTAAYEACKLAKRKLSVQEIVKYLLDTQKENTIYISIPDLKYLKKGGRLTPAAAILGTMLSIKPVLTIQNGKLDSFAKCFTFNACKVKMLNALKKDIETRFAGKKIKVFMAYTQNLEQALDFKKTIEETLHLPVEIVDELSISIAVHIGPGALACGCAIDCD